MPVKIAIQLPYPVETPTPTPTSSLELARTIEELGFHGCAVPDHPFPLIDGSGSPAHNVLDPFVLLAAIASVTTRLRLITMACVLPYRHPFVTAKAAASVDFLSAGRLILGAAAGYLSAEFEALGADFGRRNELTDDALPAIKLAWQGDPVRGAVWGHEVSGNVMLPRPAARPRPPIWIAGNSTAAMRRAIAHSDGWAPYEAGRNIASATRTATLRLRDLPQRLEEVSRRLAEAGRDSSDFDVCLLRASFDWQNRAEWRTEASRLHELGVSWMILRLPAEVDGPQARRLLSAVASELID